MLDVLGFKAKYRNSSIYDVNSGTHKKKGSKNRVNWAYLVVLKGWKIVNRSKSKIAEIETVEIKECL